MPSKILFILSGSVACYKACAAISDLVQRGHDVRAAASASALKFVGVATLEALTGQKVWTELFEPGAALDHIELERWADLVVICPATAHTLNRVAAGFGDDLIGALLLAHDWKKPLLIAPAMNPAMWRHPATAASVARLRGWGARFVELGLGRTACGEIGQGRLAEPEVIVAAVESALAKPKRKLRVLVTSGGTAEPIDGVRVLTNTSTGATGALIADQLSRAGHDVLLLRAAQAKPGGAHVRQDIFDTFASLDAALERWLTTEHFDAVIHAAAVSDFSVAAIEVNGTAHAPGKAKLSSEVAPTLRLQRNPKLLHLMRPRSRNPAICVVAFKLTEGATPNEVRHAVQALLKTDAADLVVHNDLSARVGDGNFPAQIWSASGAMETCETRAAIGVALERMLTACDARATLSSGKGEGRRAKEAV